MVFEACSLTYELPITAISLTLKLVTANTTSLLKNVGFSKVGTVEEIQERIIKVVGSYLSHSD